MAHITHVVEDFDAKGLPPLPGFDPHFSVKHRAPVEYEEAKETPRVRVIQPPPFAKPIARAWAAQQGLLMKKTGHWSLPADYAMPFTVVEELDEQMPGGTTAKNVAWGSK